MSQRVLVVDDDPSVLKLVQLNLEIEGYEVVTASNGREALEMVADEAPALVVCDVMMPVMDGLEVVRRLRRDEATESLPVVMLSAKAQDIDVKRGKEAGADEYVTKPFDPEDLIEVVQRLVSGGREAAR